MGWIDELRFVRPNNNVSFLISESASPRVYVYLYTWVLEICTSRFVQSETQI